MKTKRVSFAGLLMLVLALLAAAFLLGFAVSLPRNPRVMGVEETRRIVAAGMEKEEKSQEVEEESGCYVDPLELEEPQRPARTARSSPP